MDTARSRSCIRESDDGRTARAGFALDKNHMPVVVSDRPRDVIHRFLIPKHIPNSDCIACDERDRYFRDCASR